MILNEIRSARRTELRGAVEVHDQAADVIVANPNGLWCDGCGFINTPRVTLAAGIAETGSDGTLGTFRAAAGEVRVGEAGADLSGTEMFTLLAGRVSIEGPIAAGGALEVLAGPAGEAGGSEPGYAIDSTALGGMSAGRIRIVASGAGTGVRLRGPLAARAGEMTVTADGRLELSEARAATRIEATSGSGAVAVDRLLYAGSTVELRGATTVDLGAGAYAGAGELIELSGPTVKLGAGALAAAGVDQSGRPLSGGDLRVSATRLESGGALAAGQRLEVTAGTIELRPAESAGTALGARRRLACGDDDRSRGGDRRTDGAGAKAVRDDPSGWNGEDHVGWDGDEPRRHSGLRREFKDEAIREGAAPAVQLGEDLGGVSVGDGPGQPQGPEEPTVESPEAPDGPAAGSRPRAPAAEAPSAPAVVSPEQLDRGIDALLGRQALFELHADPDMPYLVETRREFIDPGLYLGSDYFLSRANVLPGQRVLKRLGDAYVESRLLQRQWFDLTGRRLQGAQDLRSRMQALYDGAIDAQASLELTVGVALTASQIGGCCIPS